MTGTAKLSPHEQARRHCALPGFDRRRWTGERLYRIHMGAPPRYDLEGKCGDWNEPAEDVENEGCPTAWYHSGFVESVLRYSRRRDDHGGRIANRLLDLCDDELVIEAVLRLEAHEDEWRAEYMSRRLSRADGG